MKQSILIALFFTLVLGNYRAQNIQELYEKGDYEALVKYEDKIDSLRNFDLYCLGFAFFQLENDKKAIEMYDKALEKGLDKYYVYLFKGISYRYDGQDNKAIDNFRMAIAKNPNIQKSYTELGNTFYSQNKTDSALHYFYKARELPYELGDAYIKIPNILHVQEKYDKALKEYKLSADLIDKEDPYFIELLKNIGLLEYTDTKNYANAVKAYSKVIGLVPDQYQLYPKLIKACYANEDFEHGDEVFNILKEKYEKEELPKEMMEMKGVTVDEFEINGQGVSVVKYYKEAKDFADETFRFFLLNKKHTEVVRKIHTEKSIMGGHFICEYKKNTHINHGGFKDDKIDYKLYKEVVISIMEGNKKKKKKKKKKKG